MRNRVTGFLFCRFFFPSSLMLWLILLINNRKGSEKYNKRYVKTWRSLVLVMRAHETKTNYTILSINTCKIFFQPLDVEEPNIFKGSILSKSPSQSLGCLMSENAPSPPPPAKNRLMILSRCSITRERVTTQSNPEYRQSKLRYPLAFTVIGCLHKQKDPIKPKDLMYCSIYLAPLFRFYSVFNFSQKGVKT